jgi:hypothetical protein
MLDLIPEWYVAVPAVDFFGRGETGFTPVGVDIGRFAAAADRASIEYCSNGRRYAVRR